MKNGICIGDRVRVETINQAGIISADCGNGKFQVRFESDGIGNYSYGKFQSENLRVITSAEDLRLSLKECLIAAEKELEDADVAYKRAKKMDEDARKNIKAIRTEMRVLALEQDAN